jgi:hypothetical protein
MYYRTILPFILPELWQVEVLHASAVQNPNGILGFCAVSGTGKSTISYALTQRGYKQWADDALVLDIHQDSIISVPLPARTRLRQASASYFQKTEPLPWFSSDRQPTDLAALFVMTQLTDGPVVDCTRLTPSQAFTLLLPHAYTFSIDEKERKQAMMQHYLQLAKHIPVFDLRFRAGIENLPAILTTIESHAAQL